MLSTLCNAVARCHCRRLRAAAAAAPLPAALVGFLVVLAPTALVRVGRAVGGALVGAAGDPGVTDGVVLGPLLAASVAGAALALSLPERSAFGQQLAAGPFGDLAVVCASLLVPALVAAFDGGAVSRGRVRRPRTRVAGRSELRCGAGDRDPRRHPGGCRRGRRRPGGCARPASARARRHRRCARVVRGLPRLGRGCPRAAGACRRVARRLGAGLACDPARSGHRRGARPRLGRARGRATGEANAWGAGRKPPALAGSCLGWWIQSGEWPRDSRGGGGAREPPGRRAARYGGSGRFRDGRDRRCRLERRADSNRLPARDDNGVARLAARRPGRLRHPAARALALARWVSRDGGGHARRLPRRARRLGAARGAGRRVRSGRDGRELGGPWIRLGTRGTRLGSGARRWGASFRGAAKESATSSRPSRHSPRSRSQPRSRSASSRRGSSLQASRGRQSRCSPVRPCWARPARRCGIGWRPVPDARGHRLPGTRTRRRPRSREVGGSGSWSCVAAQRERRLRALSRWSTGRPGRQGDRRRVLVAPGSRPRRSPALRLAPERARPRQHRAR